MDERQRRIVSVVAVLNIVVGACIIGGGLFSDSAWRWLWVALGLVFFVVAIANLVKIRRSS